MKKTKTLLILGILLIITQGVNAYDGYIIPNSFSGTSPTGVYANWTNHAAEGIPNMTDNNLDTFGESLNNNYPVTFTMGFNDTYTFKNISVYAYWDVPSQIASCTFAFQVSADNITYSTIMNKTTSQCDGGGGIRMEVLQRSKFD